MTHQPRALVLDDDENILSAFQDFFRREHCTMLSSSDPDEAIRILAGSVVNLVIADLRMEGGPGLALCRKIREIRPLVPLIVITGYPDLVSEEEARHAGADYYFLKPLELDALRLAVRRCLHGTLHGAGGPA